MDEIHDILHKLEGREEAKTKKKEEIIEEPVEVKDTSLNCGTCNGTGLKDERNVCPVCYGTGKV